MSVDESNFTPAQTLAAACAEPMSALIDQIVASHHAFLRARLPEVDRAAADIVAFGADEPLLVEVRQLVVGLRACIEQQLDREEQQLFPMLRRLEQQTHVSRCHAGMINSRIMMAERDLARIRGVIARLADLAVQHRSPDAGGCEACHDLLRIAGEIAADLREHTRKESDVLFPWAAAREAALVK